MILIDTSVWVDYFRSGDPLLTGLLQEGNVQLHAFVLGELLLGAVGAQSAALDALLELPLAVPATDQEVYRFIEQHALRGCGIGYVDTHLLASTALTPGARLWTWDQRLHKAAARLGVAMAATH
ncbi:PIN domain-containing protein [Xylophilus sp. GW821-FHT01B05]